MYDLSPARYVLAVQRARDLDRPVYIGTKTVNGKQKEAWMAGSGSIRFGEWGSTREKVSDILAFRKYGKSKNHRR